MNATPLNATSKTGRLEATIASLTEYRDALRADLATMGAAKLETRWHTDRVRELEATERRLASLGIEG